MYIAKCVGAERRERWRGVMLEFLTGASAGQKGGCGRCGFKAEEVRGEIRGGLGTW